MRTIGVTEGASEPDLAIWPRLSMYCRLSRSARMSHGLCSISYTMPSYLAADIAIAVSGSAWQNDVNAGLPASRARITPFRRGISAMLVPCARVARRPPQPPPSCAGRSASKTRVNALMTRASIFCKTMDCIGTRACPSSVILGAASRVNPTCGVKPGNDLEGGFDNGEARFVAFGRCRRGISVPRSRARAHTPKSDGVMIIDCHGHYTTEPKDLLRWRKEQIENVKEPGKQPSKASLKVSDDEIRESLEGAQLKLQRERGTDVTIFSPRAMGMSHHIGDYNVSLAWSQVCNEMIHRVCTLYPENFIGVCQLPQSPGVSPDSCIGELERCVKEFGFVGCNLNPD